MDFAKGVAKCVESAKAHAGVAHQLRTIVDELGGSKDIAGFAVAHATLAEEEAAKAAFCAMVESRLAPPEILEPAFRQHRPKTYLFYALAKRKIVDIQNVGGRTVVTVDQKPLAVERLRGVWDEDIPELKEHDDDRNAGFYVGKTEDRWLSPGEGCSDKPTVMVYRYLHRADVLLLFCQVILRMPLVTALSNILVEEVSGQWKLTWDEI